MATKSRDIEAKLAHEILRESSSQYYNASQISSECLCGFRVTEARVWSFRLCGASSGTMIVYHMPSFLSFCEWRGIDLRRLLH